METKEILKMERLNRNMTQQEIADYLKIGRVSYTMYETGKNTPTTENIIKLADLYNVSTDYLLGRKKPKTKPMDVVVASAIVYAFLFSLPLKDKAIYLKGEMKSDQFTNSKEYKSLTPEQQRYLYQFFEEQQTELKKNQGSSNEITT